MRALLDFPEGFGSDPTLMLDPSVSANRSSDAIEVFRPVEPADDASSRDAGYVPGPFRARSTSGLPVSALDVTIASETSGGFRPRMSPAEDAEPVWREPGSIVVPTVVVGILLAAMGYLLDVR